MSWEGLRLVVGANAQISGVPIFLGFLFLVKRPPPTRRLTSKNWFWRLGWQSRVVHTDHKATCRGGRDIICLKIVGFVLIP